jgi:hypothetical protein
MCPYFKKNMYALSLYKLFIMISENLVTYEQQEENLTDH